MPGGDPAGGKPAGLWALPKGRIGPGEDAGGDGAARGRRGDRRPRPLDRKLGDVRYVYTWDGERIFKVVSFFLVRYAGGRIGEIAAGVRRTRSPRCAGCRSRRRRACSPTAGERDMAAKAIAEVGL